jgi:D-alanyl-D-alanine carboxypeptidase
MNRPAARPARRVERPKALEAIRHGRSPRHRTEILMPRTQTRLTLGLALATFALAALVFASASPARDRSAGPNPKLQRRLDAVVAAGAPGAMLLVRDGDRTIRLTSGNGNLRPKTPMRAGDRFRVGSITKTFVATVVLQLVAERKLGLEDTVARWLPGVVPDGERITVRQLLNHTSGLFAFGGDRDFVTQASRHPLRVWTPREIVAIATGHPPTFAPGAGWSYSDTNYYVLGLIVETATGRSLAGELRRRILAPLRLRATSLPTQPGIAERHAHGYFLRPLQDVTVGSPSVQWAAGALVSTAGDLARFFRALLGGRLVRPDLLRLMETTVAARQLGPGNAYGLGLQRVPEPCGAFWGHAGGSPGYVAHALNSRDGSHQVVVLVNATGALSAVGLFGLPPRAARAVERLIHTANCD